MDDTGVALCVAKSLRSCDVVFISYRCVIFCHELPLLALFHN